MLRTTSVAAAALSLVALTLVAARAPAHAQDVLQACEADIANYCSQVTPGEGRLLACAYAHEDKLSDSCDQAISEAADQLDWFLHEVKAAIETCAVDIEKHCSEVAAGEGRIYRCLKKKKDELDPDCGGVVDEVTARLISE